MDEVYDFTALAVGALPYRFLFFTVDEIQYSVLLLGVKYGYKAIIYFGIPLTLTCKYKLGNLVYTQK